MTLGLFSSTAAARVYRNEPLSLKKKQAVNIIKRLNLPKDFALPKDFLLAKLQTARRPFNYIQIRTREIANEQAVEQGLKIIASPRLPNIPTGLIGSFLGPDYRHALSYLIPKNSSDLLKEFSLADFQIDRDKITSRIPRALTDTEQTILQGIPTAYRDKLRISEIEKDAGARLFFFLLELSQQDLVNISSPPVEFTKLDLSFKFAIFNFTKFARATHKFHHFDSEIRSKARKDVQEILEKLLDHCYDPTTSDLIHTSQYLKLIIPQLTYQGLDFYLKSNHDMISSYLNGDNYEELMKHLKALDEVHPKLIQSMQLNINDLFKMAFIALSLKKQGKLAEKCLDFVKGERGQEEEEIRHQTHKIQRTVSLISSLINNGNYGEAITIINSLSFRVRKVRHTNSIWLSSMPDLVHKEAAIGFARKGFRSEAFKLAKLISEKRLKTKIFQQIFEIMSYTPINSQDLTLKSKYRELTQADLNPKIYHCLPAILTALGVAGSTISVANKSASSFFNRLIVLMAYGICTPTVVKLLLTSTQSNWDRSSLMRFYDNESDPDIE
jgi:hypothetical protein